MSYAVHNFDDGDVFYASDANEMDAQIAENESDIAQNTSDISSLSTAKGNKAIWVNMGTISTLPVTKTVSGVTTDMVCANALLGTPSAQGSDWTVNTNTANKVTVSGTINGSTTLYLLLVPQNSVTAS